MLRPCSSPDQHRSHALLFTPGQQLSRPATRLSVGGGRHRHVAVFGTAGTVNREVLTTSERSKLDPQSDRQFYDYPRLVRHVDSAFLRQVSHLPEEVQYSRVVGHGMNAEELARNQRLDHFFVRDLNAEPDGWAVGSKSFDAVLICVSVQYLQKPEKVFAEVFRVLKPGGVCIVTFSNRLYYSKAIAAWRDNSGFGRTQLIKQYFSCIEGFTEPEAITKIGGVPPPSDPFLSALEKIQQLAQRSQGDPFYAVVSYRNFKRTE